jgi:peptidoglycan/xylan/chitin deacetylase (PgdA/CDA1 family)
LSFGSELSWNVTVLFSSKQRRKVLNLASKAFVHAPGSRRMAQFLGRNSSLRCMVFHNITDQESPFTAGIGVNTSPQEFEATLGFIKKYYSPVSLQNVLENTKDRKLPSNALLLTFDDAYASVAEIAAPLCKQQNIPAVFFVNAAFVDNRRLAPDNLVCYIVDRGGLEPINAALREVFGERLPALRSLAEIFGVFFPAISLAERNSFIEALKRLTGIDEEKLAIESKLYLTSQQVRSLPSSGFEIGNHTFTHTHCRNLSGEEVASEVKRNKTELESISGTQVRAFSQPYGSSKDVTPALARILRQSGHEAVFLSESTANPRNLDLFRLDRVNCGTKKTEALFFDLEVMPRLRTIRNQLLQRSAVLPPV